MVCSTNCVLVSVNNTYKKKIVCLNSSHTEPKKDTQQIHRSISKIEWKSIFAVNTEPKEFQHMSRLNMSVQPAMILRTFSQSLYSEFTNNSRIFSVT